MPFGSALGVIMVTADPKLYNVFNGCLKGCPSYDPKISLNYLEHHLDLMIFQCAGWATCNPTVSPTLWNDYNYGDFDSGVVYVAGEIQEDWGTDCLHHLGYLWAMHSYPRTLDETHDTFKRWLQVSCLCAQHDNARDSWAHFFKINKPHLIFDLVLLLEYGQNKRPCGLCTGVL